jgi:exodeoxyribonuclease VII large subunit
MSEFASAVPKARVWPVGALCRAIADALEARFNPVTVVGELSGFSRASSGHCYFSLKDANGQIRCAMFRRAASLVDFSPQDGDRVEVRGKLGVYEARGDLQLVVESMTRAGSGTLFEEFFKLKAKLQAESLFDRVKHELPTMPKGIGVVTSLGAAALHDVATALQRRVPHIPVLVSPAAVQGAGAPVEICLALSNLYHLIQSQQGKTLDLANPHSVVLPQISVILLVRGGGSLEDLWAFNDESLVRLLAQSPVPVITGIGHETDFTLADFVADLRAPTPTAAAELVSASRLTLLGQLDDLQTRLAQALQRSLDTMFQRLDSSASRLGRPSGLAARQQLRLANAEQRLRSAAKGNLSQRLVVINGLSAQLPSNLSRGLSKTHSRLDRASLHLSLLDPKLVLQRGYAWLSGPNGETITRVTQTTPGQSLRATLTDGVVDLTVSN